ncbi:MAG: LacI family DNA-binding transcriptional regulator [Chitinophagaceae bacterium]|nr:LacI family DNA-binding transcriptional regulator [Chitinophagaceae bacterium]
MKKSVSLKDIANQLGVSTSLVSYVLNGHAKKKRVSDGIAKKIFSTAERLNYRPNQIAKSLKTKKTQTIGLIVQEIHYRYTTGITRAIETQAKKSHYTVIIGNSHEDLSTLKELIHVLINRQVDGLIIVAAENAEAEIEYIKKQEIPFVLIDRNFPSVETNFIGIDNFRIAYQAVQYLLARKYKNIAFINYNTSFFHLQERNRGYNQALKDAGLPVKRSLHKEIRKKHYEQDVNKAMAELTSGKPACDAIFFATDTLAVSGLRNLIQRKIKIPKDISVLSFDESDAFALSECPITYFRQPLEAIGAAAVNLLFEVMNGKGECQQVYLESTLVKGRSCGEPE